MTLTQIKSSLRLFTGSDPAHVTLHAWSPQHPDSWIMLYRTYSVLINKFWIRDVLTDAQMSKLLKQRPAVVIDAVVLQHKQLADIPGSDVTWDLHSSTAVVLGVHFDHLSHAKLIHQSGKMFLDGQDQNLFNKYQYILHDTVLTGTGSQSKTYDLQLCDFLCGNRELLHCWS